jgi:hypothetical protein
MYKALANSTIFTVTYLIFVLPTYYLTYVSIIENGLVMRAFNLPSILYIVSMLAIWAICLIRGAMIGKNWLVLIPTVAFVFNLTPSLTAIPFVPYVYHFLAIIIGATSALVVVERNSILKKT